jgi:TatD DNase family protein
LKLIDTHCHLDASVFDHDRKLVIQDALASGLQMMVIPAVMPTNYSKVAEIAQANQHCCYALGMHPIYIDNVQPSDVAHLDALVAKTLQQDNKLVAIGEIGLDYYVTKQNQEIQEYFFEEQLKIANDYNLPVILHVRRAVDDVLKHLRRVKVCGGIAHAFNGSMHQAEAFIALGFKLGFGGAMTFERAKKIRELAVKLPIESIVLETDSPDMSPEWLGKGARNSPKELIKIASCLADLRRMSVSQIIEITRKNSLDVLPKMADLCTRVEVLH